MRNTLLALATITAAAVLLTVLLAATADAGDVGCADVTVAWPLVTHSPTITDRNEDPGVSVAIVGHYLWIQYAHTASSLENVVSVELHPEGPYELRVCTDYVAEGVIPQGEGTVRVVEAVEPGSDTPVLVPHSTLAPHPSIVDAWVTEQGLVTL